MPSIGFRKWSFSVAARTSKGVSGNCPAQEKTHSRRNRQEREGGRREVGKGGERGRTLRAMTSIFNFQSSLLLCLPVGEVGRPFWLLMMAILHLIQKREGTISATAREFRPA